MIDNINGFITNINDSLTNYKSTISNVYKTKSNNVVIITKKIGKTTEYGLYIAK